MQVGGRQGQVAEGHGGLLEQLRGFAALGFTEAHGWVPGVEAIRPLEILGERVVPEAAKF